ncbi:hypothetical protein FSP39_019182 [Pinctada imbricata]|uniref:Uncharacterized protein n=1 Tax=Pinctada imbricata TaxID=66713 RepID=A0AA88Y8J0_PINIB|nr:hypothetical protein FSP39_019182 [Pinctada imbricata]
MLRYIAFENLINFNDRQCLEFEEGVNFLVGANSTGKSSILELIRRCHSINLSSSVTNLLDDSKPGYIISRYEGLSDVFETNESFDTDRAILCLFQERKAGIISIYKCICFKSIVKRGLYIAASQYEKAEDNPQEVLHRFSLRHFDNESVRDFTDISFPENNDDSNPQQNDGNHNPQQNEGNHNPQQNESNHNPQQNERNHEDQDESGIDKLFGNTDYDADSQYGSHGTQEDVTQISTNTNRKGKSTQVELGLLVEIKVVLEQSGQKVENSNETSEILLEKLQPSFAHVFPFRSIGPLQWINGNNVSELDAKNYKTAHKRADILWDLLPPQEPQRELRPGTLYFIIMYLWSIISNLWTGQSLEYKNVDEDEQSLFNKVTYPLEYEFVKDTKEGKIKVIHKNDPSSTQRHFELIKAPEGIIEVKQATLIFSHKKFKTICYEDIDKGIHNQMIENMTSFMLKEMKRKTVIIVTHNPSLINCWALGRTHVCTRKRESEGKFVNIVKKIPDKYAIQYGFHHEMKKVLFSARVLLVEGRTELSVLRALFDFIFCKKERSDLLARRLNNGDVSARDRDHILRMLSLVQCVSVNGKLSFQRAKNFCKDVNINFKVLADNDDICQQRKLLSSPLESFTVPERPTGDVNTFMWKNGTIEDALRSDCPSEIMKILNYTVSCKDWEDKTKNKLKRKINNEFENTIYDNLFAELLNNIESNEESEFLDFFRFITNQN